MRNGSNDNITIISDISTTPLTVEEHCFSFWYFDDSELLYELNVMSILGHKVYRTVRPNMVGFTWKLIQVDIIPIHFHQNTNSLYSMFFLNFN